MDLMLAPWFLAFVLAVGVTVLLTLAVMDEVEDWKVRRRARLEAELDRKQKQLCQTILHLADALATDREEASRQMARTAYLTTGELPDSPQ